MKTIIVFSVVLVTCLAQRSPYAGRLPIGFPYIEPSTAAPDQLGNRFGDDDGTTTTIRLPLEALGDAALVQRLSKLPIDQQPFWLINWKALEENRNNPQTYPQRGNSFVDTPDRSNSADNTPDSSNSADNNPDSSNFADYTSDSSNSVLFGR